MLILIIISVILIIIIGFAFVFLGNDQTITKVSDQKIAEEVKQCEDTFEGSRMRSLNDLENMFQMCLTQIYLSTSDPNLCEYLYVPREGEICQKVIIRLMISSMRAELNRINRESDVFEECNKLNDIKEKNLCITSKIDVEDYERCSEIKDNYYRDSCYGEFGFELYDLELCDKITESDTMGSCYHGVAKRLKDPEICNDIVDESWKDTCYIFLAPESGTSLCLKISNDNSRDGCYTNYAFVTGDVSDCDKVKDEYDRDRCFKHEK